MKSRDLFAPALAQVGLHPDRAIYAEAGDEKTVLLLFEEGLRHAGLAGVVAEVSRLPMVASRRLQLAAETSGVVALALRRWRSQAGAAEFGSPTAAMSRWRIAPLPSSPLPRDDAPFKALVDRATAELYRSPEIDTIYAKWFQSPVPPRGVNYALPMPAALKRAFAHPTDSPDPASYAP